MMLPMRPPTSPFQPGARLGSTCPDWELLGSLRYGHYGLRTTVIHGEDLVRDLLRMLDSTWVSQSVVWLQATGSSRGDSRSEDYVSIFLPIFDQF